MANTPEMKKPFIKISFALASLFFYLGTCLNYLQKTSVDQYKDVTQVILAGNGSRIVEWLSLPQGMEKADYLGYFFRQGLGEDSFGFELLESDKRKHEVALGLIKADPKMATVTYNTSGGSTPTVNDSAQASTTKSTAQTADSSASDYLARFLVAFCQHTSQDDIDLLFKNDIRFKGVFKAKATLDDMKENEKIIAKSLVFNDSYRQNMIKSDAKHASWLYALDLLTR